MKGNIIFINNSDNKQFDPSELVSITESTIPGDQMEYTYRNCNIKERIDSVDGYLLHVIAITPVGIMPTPLSAAETSGLLRHFSFSGSPAYSVKGEKHHLSPFVGTTSYYAQLMKIG